ncbi:MAG: HEAT repeat domain-containing protein, partial [Planctomycetota bacterium]
MRVILIGLLLAGSAFGQSDALKAYKAELKRLDTAEKKFWRAFQGRFSQALITFRQELELADAKPDEHKEATYDYTDFRSLYGDFAAIQEAIGQADLALAESGHAKAAGTLLKELFKLIKVADKLEQELAEARPKARYYVFDQRMGVQRHGLGVRQPMLIQALAKCPDAAATLVSQGFKKAEKGDGKRSVSCRVAIMDALALTKDDKARALLEPRLKERLSSLRIAAVEALLGFGPEAREVLEPLLQDESAIVQRALIREIRFRCAKDPGWIPPVLQLFRASTGLVRDEALRTLEALTNQRFGYA